MENEFMKRGYLLPDGCKDLMDVLKPKEPKHSSTKPATAPGYSILPGMMEKYYAETAKEIAAMPRLKKEYTIPRQVSVSQLMQLLTKESFNASENLEMTEVEWTSLNSHALMILFDLAKTGLCKRKTDILDFETVSKVLAKYGVTCKLAEA
jgi:hypothetical protein